MTGKPKKVKTVLLLYLKCANFYPTAIKGCWGIVFIHCIRMGGRADGEKSLSGLYLRNHNMQEVDNWQGHWLGV